MIEITKGYGKAEWQENLRTCLLMAGVDNKPVVFLFDDTQVVFEGMLEDINNVLNTGDVPNLYVQEDEDRIMVACKGDCLAKRIPATKLNIMTQYINRVKRNIHVVLTMSPLGEAFRTRLRKFPSITNCCTCDWFREWPDEALQSVATRSFQESDIELGDNETLCIDFVRFIHQSVAQSTREYEAVGRHNYVTPTSYLELLSTYRTVLMAKRKEIGQLKDRLQNGLDKLVSTAEMVTTLQAQILEMQPILAKTQVEVGEMIVVVTKDKEEAAVTQAFVESESSKAEKKAAETKAIADDAQRDLDEALPALDKSLKALDKLSVGDIQEVKALG